MNPAVKGENEIEKIKPCFFESGRKRRQGLRVHLRSADYDHGSDCDDAGHSARIEYAAVWPGGVPYIQDTKEVNNNE